MNVINKHPLPKYNCHKTDKPVKIDGVLDDQAWKNADPVELVLSDGSGKPTRKTTAKMCWDDMYLYVAFDAEDPDIWGTFTNRDDRVHKEEVVEIFFDPDCDLKEYFEINVSPRNVIFDTTITNPTTDKPTVLGIEWNCEGLKTAVVVDGTLDNRNDTDKRWTVEMAIPFASLGEKTPIADKTTWRVNLYRIDLTPTPEFCAWSPTLVTPASFHISNRFGYLMFTE